MGIHAVYRLVGVALKHACFQCRGAVHFSGGNYSDGGVAGYIGGEPKPRRALFLVHIKIEGKAVAGAPAHLPGENGAGEGVLQHEHGVAVARAAEASLEGGYIRRQGAPVEVALAVEIVKLHISQTVYAFAVLNVGGDGGYFRAALHNGKLGDVKGGRSRIFNFQLSGKDACAVKTGDNGEADGQDGVFKQQARGAPGFLLRRYGAALPEPAAVQAHAVCGDAENAGTAEIAAGEAGGAGA